MSNPNDIHEERLSLLLPTPITDEDKETMCEELVDKTVRIDKLTAEKKETNADFTKQINAYKVSINRLAPIIDNGVHEIEVDVMKTIDYNTRQVVYRRLDTNEAYESRDATEDELQMSLPIDNN